MPSLNAMRGLAPDETDLTRQPLGHPTRPASGVPDTASKPTGTPGILQKPDGMLETQLPTPVGVPGSPLTPFILPVLASDFLDGPA